MSDSSIVTLKEWKMLLERDEYRCLYCGSEEDLQPAHYIDRSLGADNSLDNLMTLCNECHRLSHDGKLRVRRINGRFFFKRLR